MASFNLSLVSQEMNELSGTPMLFFSLSEVSFRFSFQMFHYYHGVYSIPFTPSESQSMVGCASSRECLLFRLLPLLRSHVCPLWIAAGQTSWSEPSEVCPGSPNPEDSIRWVLLHRPSPSHLQHFQHLQIYQQSICPEGARGDVACSLEKSARAQTLR